MHPAQMLTERAGQLCKPGNDCTGVQSRHGQSRTRRQGRNARLVAVRLGVRHEHPVAAARLEQLLVARHHHVPIRLGKAVRPAHRRASSDGPGPKGQTNVSHSTMHRQSHACRCGGLAERDWHNSLVQALVVRPVSYTWLCSPLEVGASQNGSMSAVPPFGKACGMAPEAATW
jgi:hypothetical protein